MEHIEDIRKSTEVGSSTMIWPRRSLDASQASSLLGSSFACSVSRTRSPAVSLTCQVAGSQWTLPPSQASSSPLLSSSDRLSMSQVFVAVPANKGQAASISTSTFSGNSTGTPPQQSPAETPPMATVIETREAENLEGSRTCLKAVRFRQGSASIIGSPMDGKTESLANSRQGSYGGA
eukprot:symbB.v1.2.006497.t1/scaffold361.1/size299464/20